MALRVIQGGAEPPPLPFEVHRIHEDDGAPGFQVVWVTGQIGRYMEDGELRVGPVNTVVGWPVNDKAVADAFATAMNERYAQDFADDPL